MLTRTAAAVCALALATTAHADAHQSDAEVLYDALRLDEIVAVMSEEGIVYGESIGAEMFPDRVDDNWAGVVGEIYAVSRMTERVQADFTALAEDMDLAPMIAFFETDLGRQVAELELTARQAMLDEEIEEAAKETAAIAMMDETPRAAQIEAFIDGNDLVEQNVVGALNSNYAFYTGLIDGGGFPQGLGEEDVLADVWNQEPEIRSNTREWMSSFLLMAYAPLSDEELDDYMAFSQTDAGQDLNRLLFGGFDPLFVDISRELGLASSRYMQGADL
ncbi:MAG: DUF2059 domain-containing protein [Paracoccaceae bacterium]